MAKIKTSKHIYVNGKLAVVIKDLEETVSNEDGEQMPIQEYFEQTIMSNAMYDGVDSKHSVRVEEKIEGTVIK